MLNLSEKPAVAKQRVYRSGDGCELFVVTLDPPRKPERPPVVLLHGGGPDHHSMMPLGRKLTNLSAVVLPDIRGYGRSICADPARHTWNQYTSDVLALLDHLGIGRAVLIGTGIGTTISLRVALAHPERLAGIVLISVEDIEDDLAKEEEIKYLEAFARQVRTEGIAAAWGPVLPHFAPMIGNLVRDAIPRSDQMSIAAAAAIGYDRSFRSVDELAGIIAPVFVIPGNDARHPPELAAKIVETVRHGELAGVTMSGDMQNANDFAEKFAPSISKFLIERCN